MAYLLPCVQLAVLGLLQPHGQIREACITLEWVMIPSEPRLPSTPTPVFIILASFFTLLIIKQPLPFHAMK